MTLCFTVVVLWADMYVFCALLEIKLVKLFDNLDIQSNLDSLLTICNFVTTCQLHHN